MEFYQKVLAVLIFVVGFVSFLFQSGKINIPLLDVELVEVVEVLDGDSIVLSDGREVRYLGINTTEFNQPYYEQAKEFNRDLVLGKKIKLEFDEQKTDRYGRLLAYIWQDGKLINQEIVRRGLAINMETQPNVKYQHLFIKAQEDAINDCENIWEGLCSLDNSSQCVKIIKIEENFNGNDKKNKNNEWIGFENYCDVPINMRGWLLKDSSSSNFYTFEDTILGIEGKIFLYSGCGENIDNKFYWECPEREYLVWNNSGDQALLFNQDNKLVDYYKY